MYPNQNGRRFPQLKLLAILFHNWYIFILFLKFSLSTIQNGKLQTAHEPIKLQDFTFRTDRENSFIDSTAENSRTFKNFYCFSRTFQVWNFIFQIQGLSKIFKNHGNTDYSMDITAWISKNIIRTHMIQHSLKQNLQNTSMCEMRILQGGAKIWILSISSLVKIWKICHWLFSGKTLASI